MATKIKKVEISKLWGKYDIVWDNINEDINILIGINGGGKSTLLKLIRDCIISHSKTVLKNYRIDGCRVVMDNDSTYTCLGVFGESTDLQPVEIDYINIFEPNITKLRKGESILDNQLDRLLYQRDSSINNFTNFRLKASIITSQTNLQETISRLFGVINNMFSNTEKEIVIAENNIDIQFRNRHGDIIPLNFLSAGEKQLLIIIFKIFLTENRHCIALFDEPETSLHIDWQEKFIDMVSTLNPNMQMIISTHSPSIFGDGWADKLTFMEDIVE